MQHVFITNLLFKCSNTFKGAKIEASVWASAQVARFNHVLQPGCKYTIHRVIISPNAESVEFRAIGHLFECHFNRGTVVEPSLPIEFPILPKHLMPFPDVAERPNKTFVGMYRISFTYRNVTNTTSAFQID
jgi:hypothetical protein